MAQATAIRDCFSEPIDPPGNLSGLRAAIAAEPGAVMLESTGRGSFSRFSVYAARPIKQFQVSAREDLLQVMEQQIARETSEALPFAGGWFGFLSYEAGQLFEPAAGWRSLEMDVPLGQWGLYESVLLLDHESDTWRVAGVKLRDSGWGPDRCVAWWGDMLERLPGPSNETATVSSDYSRSVGDDCPADYLQQVSRVLEYIRGGDVYQVNLARRLRTPWGRSPVALYDRLCRFNPATHAAYISVTPTSAIISSSPELFLEVRSGAVTTRPIKGTRPRGGDPVFDKISRTELENSEKDHAELNMIIDLERNDLGRICEVGSVKVENDGEIETLPTVFHRTATITGRLNRWCTTADLLRATFPGGSVTGAPKVRAMQIIQELEPFARGPYCGAIGWIGLNGDLSLNLPIRTMLAHDGLLDLFVGSGIVADSDPEMEFEELEAKATGMKSAIEAARQERVPSTRSTESVLTF